MSLPALLRVEDVKARYGMRDERTARRLMNAAGGFKAGGRLVIREDALGEYERRQARSNPAPPPRRSVAPSRGRTASLADPSTGADWWRADG